MSIKTLLTAKEIDIISRRLACQLVENHLNFEDTVIVGLQPRGIYFAERICRILKETYQLEVKLGYLDITFFRDDFRRGHEPLSANKTSIDFVVENKNVIFVDDVLYTGRSIRSALTAIQSFGRPKLVELLVLIDRRFSRHLPIQPTYKGRQVDAINQEKVKVMWEENDGEDGVIIINSDTYERA